MLVLILLLAFSIRIAPLAIDSFKGPDPLFHIRMSELVVSEFSIPDFDSLSMQGRQYSYAPEFHILFAFLFLFTAIPIDLLAMLLPALYGTMTVLIVYCFAKRLFGEKTALFSAFSLALMGLHIARTASYARPDSLSLLIVPAVLFLVFRKKYFSATILSSAQVLLHPLSAMYLYLFLVGWIVFQRFKTGKWITQIFPIIFIPFLLFVGWLAWFSLPIESYLSSTSLESSEMSSPSILSMIRLLLFSWIFILLGLKFVPKKYFLKFWFGFSFIYGLFSTRLLLFFSLPAAIVAGRGLSFTSSKTVSRKKFFYMLIFLLAVSSLVFTLTSFNKFTSSSDRSALSWLGDNSLPSSVVASIWDYGHPITYFSSRQVLVDGYFEFAPQLEERNADSKTLFQSSDCEKISEIVNRWGLTHSFAGKKWLFSETVKNGLLEADCSFVHNIYSSDSAKLFFYN